MLADVPLSLETLTLLKWRQEEGKVQKFELMKLVSARWKTFGMRVGQALNILDGWETQYLKDFRVCWCKVMQQWLDDDGTLEYPATWRGVIVVLEDVDFREVAQQLEIVLPLVTPPSPPQPVEVSISELARTSDFVSPCGTAKLLPAETPPPEPTVTPPPEPVPATPSVSLPLALNCLHYTDLAIALASFLVLGLVLTISLVLALALALGLVIALA